MGTHFLSGNSIAADNLAFRFITIYAIKNTLNEKAE